MTPREYAQATATLDLAQREVARIMGVDYSTATRWKSGESRVPGSVAILLHLMREDDRIFTRVRELSGEIRRGENAKEELDG